MENIKIVLLVIFTWCMSILMIVKPEILWKIEHFWCTSKDSEPCDLYLSLLRLGGTILLMLAIIISIVLFMRFSLNM